MPSKRDDTTGTGIYGAQEVYRRVRAFFTAWPFRPLLAEPELYLWAQTLFPSRLPPLSTVYETGISDVYTLLRRALPGENVMPFVPGMRGLVTPKSLCACIVRARHGLGMCPAITRLAETELYAELEAWIDDDREWPAETPELDPGPVCPICRTATHGRDFGPLYAEHTISISYPMLIALMEISSIMRVGPYRIIRYGIACMARGDAADPLPPEADLLVSHHHYSQRISWARSPASDHLLAAGAAAMRIDPGDAVRRGIAIAITRLASTLGDAADRLLTQRAVANRLADRQDERS